GGGVSSFQCDFIKYLWINVRIDDFDLHNARTIFPILFPQSTKKGTNTGKSKHQSANFDAIM
ncbi:hypothetical protein, partial [Gardnerella vaginalis]|uniref:hypothetical protein n=1 Tax=Gardnerella vaginalis TaxID=2702 RepID=UPI000353D7D8